MGPNARFVLGGMTIGTSRSNGARSARERIRTRIHLEEILRRTMVRILGIQRIHQYQVRSWSHREPPGIGGMEMILLRVLILHRPIHLHRYDTPLHLHLHRYHAPHGHGQLHAGSNDDSRRQLGSQPRGRKPDDQDGAGVSGRLAWIPSE